VAPSSPIWPKSSLSSPLVVDIGGEGRHPEAWNVNPSPVKTLGPGRGEPIPRLLAGRAESLPLEDQGVDVVIVEKTPLRKAALLEIARVIAPGGKVILRHVPLPDMDCHALAKTMLPGMVTQRIEQIGSQTVQVTEFQMTRQSTPSPLLRSSWTWIVIWIGLVTTWTNSPVSWGDEPPYDLVLRGGRVVDGTGNPWFEADVAIVADRIVAIGKLSEATGKREIDATNLVVAPGFIDMHSHSDWTLLEDGDGQSKIRQGVTTDVLGEGSSGGPYTGQLPPRRVDFASRRASIETLGDYFDVLEESTISLNIASYVGINNVWQSVMGYSFERPSAEQLEEMKRLVAQAMEDGAFGLSTQVMTPPGSLARTEDLIALSEVAARYGGIYSSHIRNEGTGVFDSVAEAIEIGEKAGIPVDVIHLKIADQQAWGNMRGVVEMFEAARRRGVNVQANVYPYTRGNNNLASIIPPWAHEGGRAKLLERLADPAQRVRLKRDIEEGIPGWYNHYTAVGKDWSRMLISDNSPYRGETMDRVIAEKSEGIEPPPDPLDILFDLLLEQGGSMGTVYAHHEEQDMNLAMVQPWCSIGSDGSALSVEGPLRRGNPHPRNFGTFPRVLGVYVRERGLLTLEDAVRKMTSLNAAKLGIHDRGILRPGFHADVTVFDPERVIDHSTYTEPFQYNEGIEYVIVNGQVVLEGEQHTGARPGRVLRHRHSSQPR
jgi:N-acyl-D-amino-acid deacylase